jgi:hypothetical protein
VALSLYPQILRHLLEACKSYRQGTIGLDDLQINLSNDGDQLVAHEERNLRELLLGAEGRLELLRFTVDQASLFERSLEVVGAVELELARWLGPTKNPEH